MKHIMISIDPDTDKIKKICESLVGSEIKLSFTITLQSGMTCSGKINNCNIIGDCMENVIFPFIKKQIPSFQEGPKQSSPDFYNGDDKKWEWELKCFNNNPGFDISNFNSYISQIEKNLEKKLYRTQYMIFRYSFSNNIVKIEDFKLCNIWNLINYEGKYPISLQCKKGMWYNIRPCSFQDINSKNKTPDLFIKQICKAILESPNTIINKENIINTIETQFHDLNYSQILCDFNSTLNIASNTGGVAMLPNKSE